MKQPTIERLPDVLHRIGVSRSTLYSLIKSGHFKAPISLGARAVGWLSSDVDEFIEARVKASRPQAKEGSSIALDPLSADHASTAKAGGFLRSIR